MERAKGIEPSYAAWEAAVLPLNYARKINHLGRVLSFVLTRFWPCLITFSAALSAKRKPLGATGQVTEHRAVRGFSFLDVYS